MKQGRLCPAMRAARTFSAARPMRNRRLSSSTSPANCSRPVQIEREIPMIRVSFLQQGGRSRRLSATLALAAGLLLAFPAHAQPPVNISVSPSAGTGATQTFTFTASDPGGYANITDAYFLFNWAVSGSAALITHAGT